MRVSHSTDDRFGIYDDDMRTLLKDIKNCSSSYTKIVPVKNINIDSIFILIEKI